MFRTSSVSALILTMTIFAPALAQEKEQTQANDPKPKGFMAASATVTAFFKGLHDEDLDAVIATVAVPWVQKGVMIIESKDDLREFLGRPMREEDLTDLKAEMTKVETFKSMRGKGDGGELLKEVAKDDDVVFQMKIKYGTESETLMLLVRVTEGGAKIIGAGD